MADSSPKVQTLPGGGFISTAFIFETVAFQNAANGVYQQKSTADAFYIASNPVRPKTYIFRTDYERMQYIIGRQATSFH
jgi:hypothetical protein